MNFLDFSLNDWLHYLEHVHLNEIQLGLDRVSTVASRLGLLHWDATIITVAGTNGKGSTVAALEAIYLAAGYCVASYTSPHLIAFNERIRVNQQAISDEHLCSAFIEIEQCRAETHLTYFEMATLAALSYFKHFKLDVIILEVGMGGRLDATNIIDSDLAIITTVDFDHQDFLGDTIDAIGYEKAGILRMNKPFIYSDNVPPASVVARADVLNTPMYCLGVDYSFSSTNESLLLSLPTDELLRLPSPGINHKAAAAAIIASHCLQQKLPVTLEQFAQAMREVSISGRQQVIQGPITTVFDVSHNPQAVLLLADFIRRLQPKGKVHAVFSGLKDKDLCGLIKPMRLCVDFWYPVLLSGKRAASQSQLLAAIAAEDCLVTACVSDPLTAYQEIVQKAEPDDLIIVYGSFLIVSAIMVGGCMEWEALQ